MLQWRETDDFLTYYFPLIFFVIYYSLQLKYMVVRQLDMLTDGGCDYTGSLCLCLGNDKFAHDAAVIIVQVADWFIQK